MFWLCLKFVAFKFDIRHGMNFEYMPELTWRFGYFGVLGVMFVVGFSMLMGLWLKGWFK